MAGTYTQLTIHCVFAVKHREKLLLKPWREDLFKYMSGVITNKGQKSLNVNGVEDHVHLLIGLKPSIALSDLIRDVKNNSSKFINENNLTPKRFEWQSGYGAFSCSPSHLINAYRYIENQEYHHLKKCFKEEYLVLLQEYGVDYKEEFVFDQI